MSRLGTASFVALLMLVSRLLGLARDLSLAYFFPRAVTDAFAIAFRLPTFMRRLAGDASLSLSLVPWLQRQSRSTEVILINSIWFSLLLALTTGYVIPHIFAKHFTSATLELFPWCGAYLFFTTITVVFGSLLHAEHKYTEFSLFTLAFNTLFLILIFMGIRELGLIVFAAALAQLFVVVWYFRNHLRLILSRVPFRPDGATLKSLLVQITASAGSIGLFPLLAVANTTLAVNLSEGVPTWLLWADRIIELPVSLVAGSLVLTHRDDNSKTGPFGILLLLLPASVGLYFLAPAIIHVLFSSAQVSATDLTSTTFCLSWLASTLVPQGYSRWLLAQGFRSNLEREILWSTFILLILHLGLATYLKSILGFQGLLISTVAVLFLQLLYWLVRLREVWSFLRYCLGQLFPTAALAYLLVYLLQKGPIASPAELFATILLGAAFYLLLSCGIHYQKLGPQIDSLLRSLRR